MNSSKSLQLPVAIVVISGCLLLLMSFGYRSGFGLFVKPLSDANQWGREVISLALALQNLCWGVVAVFAGAAADKFGNVKVIVVASLLYGLGMFLMAGVDTPWLLHSSTGLLVGAGVAGTSFGIVLPALARAVAAEKRQQVLGLGTAAGSMGQFLLVPLSQVLIDNFGWISALHILSLSVVGMILLAIPLAPFGGPHSSGDDASHRLLSQVLKDAAGHRSYLLLVSGFFVCGFHVAFISAHLPAYLSDLGFDSQVGAWSIALIGFCNVIGAYMSGVWSGKLSKRFVLMFIYLTRGVVIAGFLVTPVSLPSILIFSALMGFLWLSTVPPTSGLVATMFGTRYMATLYGIVFLSHQLGSFSGVWLGGWLYDQFGSYDPVWWIGIALSIFAGVVHFPIQEQTAPGYSPA